MSESLYNSGRRKFATMLPGNPMSTISAQVFGMVKGSCLEEVGVCVLDGRMGRLTPGARARSLFDCIRSSREIGYFSGFLDSMGEVDEEEDEGSLDVLNSNRLFGFGLESVEDGCQVVCVE
ncbi:hypothetical protein ACH5RR_006803 [Cinchona calisaya]|uniref:Uncharacterized protein n=1 Tax=Cinchona calisaya TaxID=153742 RepID=A0ABD3AQ13_9GENT